MLAKLALIDVANVAVSKRPLKAPTAAVSNPFTPRIWIQALAWAGSTRVSVVVVTRDDDAWEEAAPAAPAAPAAASVGV